MLRQTILLKAYLAAILGGLLLVGLPTTGVRAASIAEEADSPKGGKATGSAIQTVFVILMENKDWSQIYNNIEAPFINFVLLPMASYAEAYYNPPGIHPSEPNYIWLEAGDNLGVEDDEPPSINHQSTTEHLVTLLENSGISWKAYQEDITGAECPLTDYLQYAPKHNPMVFFDDVTDSNDPFCQYCIEHIRSYEELEWDLESDTAARYNFITPNLCHDMHDCSIQVGDAWLAREVPKILNSRAYQEGGVLFITWDEGDDDNDNPIGMIVLSPYAKGFGYSNTVYYTHSSTLRTIQEIFQVGPLLRDAAYAENLSDLFSVFP